MRDIYQFLQNSINHKRLAHSYLMLQTKPEINSRFINNISQLLLGAQEKIANKVFIAERLIIAPNEKGVIEKKEIEKILAFARIKPIFSKKRLVIIKNAHLLTLPAANNLLKIIEEPPAYLIFFLLSRRIELLPQTVLSRCIVLKEMSRKTAPILKKIAIFHQEISKANLNKLFILAESLSKKSKGEIIELFNGWLGLLGDSLKDNVASERCKKIIFQIYCIKQSKTILETSHASLRLVLERLFLKLKTHNMEHIAHST
jgi:DNA polymerase-3 subunit delta'